MTHFPVLSRLKGMTISKYDRTLFLRAAIKEQQAKIARANERHAAALKALDLRRDAHAQVLTTRHQLVEQSLQSRLARWEEELADLETPPSTPDLDAARSLSSYDSGHML